MHMRVTGKFDRKGKARKEETTADISVPLSETGNKGVWTWINMIN